MIWRCRRCLQVPGWHPAWEFLLTRISDRYVPTHPDLSVLHLIVRRRRTVRCEPLQRPVIVYTLSSVRITYDPAKRQKTLDERGLDFKDAALVFKGVTVEVEDVRKDYGERRISASAS